MNEIKSSVSAETTEIMRLTTEIVAAYVSNNAIAANDLPGMIRTVHSTLTGLDQNNTAADVDLAPAVPVKKSVTPDYIVCLEDGKKLKMLKRYLRSQYGLTPEEYRAAGTCPTTIRWWRRTAAQRALALLIGLLRGLALAAGLRRCRSQCRSFPPPVPPSTCHHSAVDFRASMIWVLQLPAAS